MEQPIIGSTTIQVHTTDANSGIYTVVVETLGNTNVTKDNIIIICIQ